MKKHNSFSINPSYTHKVDITHRVRVSKKEEKKMSSESPRENWLLRGYSLAGKAEIIRDDINHETNIYQTQGITRMPASALGCLCVMQVYGRYLNPIEKEREAETDGCFPFHKWLYAFQDSRYLSLTNMTERDALDFWREFSASSQWREVWKPWTESLSGDDIGARWWYMNWLRGVHDRRFKVKWDDIYKDIFRFRNGPFGFEIIEILIRPHWLGDRLYSESDSSSSDGGSEGGEGSEGNETSEISERLAEAHQELATVEKLLALEISAVVAES